MKRFVAVLAVLAVLYVLFFNPFGFSWLPFGHPQTDETVTGDVQSIKIETSGAEVQVVPENGNRLWTKLDGGGSASVQKNGNTINVKMKGTDWFLPFSWFRHPDLTVYIPQDYRRNLDLTVGSGTLSFDGKSANDPYVLEQVILNVRSGTADLRDFSARSLKLEEASGLATLSTLSINSAAIHVQSGILNLKHYSGPVSADVQSGNLNAQFAELKGPVTVDVQSGLATIDLPDNADFTLNGKIASGFIDCRLPLKNEQSDSTELKGTHGSGKYTVNLSVRSGLINLR
ncbi:DUF4097 family beta strand repeat-containing protein [Sporolactobacillus putidus]|uniref:DUF4097 domain-containing protein n=1 Tax=Sporolactobacillus putidus TaxID=492735 RepID=A0A917S2Y5_9BACL|nr:DUF4097 family beta strand repeat-containing protein [Sporolactobacillus putidus]GGL51820.1 hypothetical protein GCM10007968_14960 [Sporolactobacillus putidus]